VAAAEDGKRPGIAQGRQLGCAMACCRPSAPGRVQTGVTPESVG